MHTVLDIRMALLIPLGMACFITTFGEWSPLPRFPRYRGMISFKSFIIAVVCNVILFVFSHCNSILIEWHDQDPCAIHEESRYHSTEKKACLFVTHTR